VAPEAKPAFNEWCDTAHHFDVMQVDGFLSLRRLELVEGTTDGDMPEFRVLTMYQLAKPGDAAPDSPSYARHNATSVPPPAGMFDHVTFERTVYERVGSTDAETVPVGAACVSIVGEEGPWLEDAAHVAAATPGVLSTSHLATDERGALLVDVDDVTAGRVVLAALDAVDHGGRRRSLQLFRQVFPGHGVLLRDRQIRA
jgi:hypothetical protein